MTKCTLKRDWGSLLYSMGDEIGFVVVVVYMFICYMLKILQDCFIFGKDNNNSLFQ